MADPFPVSTWPAYIALSGVVGGYFATYIVSQRTVYINSITKERSQWIDKLRANISEFVADLDLYSVSFELMFNGKQRSDYSIVTPTIAVERGHKLDRSAAALQLQLNPRGCIDGNLALLISKGSSNRDKPIELINRLEKQIIDHGQWLLKVEWEKVKYEARGALWRLFHYGDKDRLLNEYTRWRNTDGAYDDLLVTLSKSHSALSRPAANE